MIDGNIKGELMHQFSLYNKQCRESIFNGHDFLITEVGVSNEDKTRLGVNCNGYGRIRVFQRSKESDWVNNPLPFNPYANSMGKEVMDELPVQVFQVAKCNLNCWWCFIPDEFKNCNIDHCKWFSVDELLELFIRDGKQTANIIDLSGGNPELVPEFVLHFMKGLDKLHLSDEVYLWSDDVLTSDYLFTKLTNSQIQYMVQYQHYGKVACFKGIDDASYCFNICSRTSFLNQQLINAKKYIDLGFDIYFYIVLTLSDMNCINKRISIFFDQLQKIAYYLPLRVVPIKIKKFATNEHRINPIRNRSIINQKEALLAWQEEISKRFNSCEIERDISLQPTK